MNDCSQYGETTFLKEYFSKKVPVHKTLVDIGAKGIKLSNTYGLLQEGWSGVLVEPLPEHYKQLEQDFKHLDVILENVAVSDFDGEALFYIHKIPGHSSLVRSSDQSIIVRVATLETLLSTHNIPYNFGLISIDTEGNDGNIIRYMLEETLYTPSVLVYEKGPSVDIQLLEKHYRQIHETKGNSIYEKR
jgi:FkbM family methyltransferase